MKFRPLHDRVVVKRIEEEQKTKGGIIIPDTAKEKPMQGEILAVGPGARNEDGDLIPMGDSVGVACCSASGRHRGRAAQGRLLIPPPPPPPSPLRKPTPHRRARRERRSPRSSREPAYFYHTIPSRHAMIADI